MMLSTSVLGHPVGRERGVQAWLSRGAWRGDEGSREEQVQEKSLGKTAPWEESEQRELTTQRMFEK